MRLIYNKNLIVSQKILLLHELGEMLYLFFPHFINDSYICGDVRKNIIIDIITIWYKFRNDFKA